MTTKQEREADEAARRKQPERKRDENAADVLWEEMQQPSAITGDQLRSLTAAAAEFTGGKHEEIE